MTQVEKRTERKTREENLIIQSGWDYLQRCANVNPSVERYFHQKHDVSGKWIDMLE